MKERSPQCAVCPYDWPERLCRREDGKAPKNCPTARHRELIRQSVNEVQTGAMSQFARAASIQEAEGYIDKDKGYASVRPIKPRILDIIEFARSKGLSRVF